jgi:hypothetical protein
LQEVEIQKKVRNFLTNKPLSYYKTKEGNVIQIISPGIINVSTGPDFLDFALMMNGKVIVGNVEFHRKSNEWLHHGHDKDKNYENVILHIVFEDNVNFQGPDILVLKEEEILRSEENVIDSDIASYEEIQHFALLRLLRKSSIAQKNLNKNGQKKGILITLDDFLVNYLAKKRRPVYDADFISNFILKFESSKAYMFLEKIIDGVEFDIHSKLIELSKEKIYNEGNGLRTEILINCISPLSLCMSETKQRIQLLEWYWSAKAINKYGILKRRFEELSQTYIWQQQGMLEYLKDHGNKRKITAEEIEQYGIHQILNFYSYGKME